MTKDTFAEMHHWNQLLTPSVFKKGVELRFWKKSVKNLNNMPKSHPLYSLMKICYDLYEDHEQPYFDLSRDKESVIGWKKTVDIYLKQRIPIEFMKYAI